MHTFCTGHRIQALRSLRVLRKRAMVDYEEAAEFARVQPDACSARRGQSSPRVSQCSASPPDHPSIIRMLTRGQREPYFKREHVVRILDRYEEWASTSSVIG
jgi:hypothetical protein